MSTSKFIAIALTTFVCATALAVDVGAQGRGGGGGGGRGGGGVAGAPPSRGGGRSRVWRSIRCRRPWPVGTVRRRIARCSTCRRARRTRRLLSAQRVSEPRVCEPWIPVLRLRVPRRLLRLSVPRLRLRLRLRLPRLLGRVRVRLSIWVRLLRLWI